MSQDCGMRHHEGVVELPNAVFVAEDVLGASFDCKAGDVTFTLAFPHAPADAEAVSSALGQPYPVDDVVLSDENAGGVWSWGYASNSKRMPDGQEQFLRANREPDYRVAVIEAATAAEVALAGALDVRLSDVAAATRELILKNANGLVGLLKLLESIDGVTQSERLSKRVADQLNPPGVSRDFLKRSAPLGVGP